MCEVRFNVSAKDGKLEGMLKCVPSGVRTEVIKEAIRYFLCAVRDNKVESDYIDASILSEFKTEVKERNFSLDDVFRLMESRPIAQPTIIQSTIQSNDIHKADDTKVEEVVTEEDKDEFDIDLDEDSFNDSVDTISINDIDTDNMDW